MRIVILAALFISFFTIAHADEKMIRIKTQKKKPAILLNPNFEIILLKDVKFEVHQVKRQEILRRLRSGGDDVGNGGDEIRRQILNEIEEIKKQVGPGYRIPNLSTRGLAIVNNLELNGINYPALKTEDGILIDRSAYKSLLISKKDIRVLLLDLLFVGSDQTDMALTIYSSLSSKKGFVPYCHDKFPLSRLVKKAGRETFKGTGSMKSLSEKALQACQNKGLNECRIIETGKSGFTSWARNFATYQGYTYKTEELSSIQKKRKSCELAKKCELIYELAPLSQVGPSNFKEIESNIEKLCF